MRLVIVEDMLSQIRLAAIPDITCLCLLGTSLSSEQFIQLSKLPVKQVFIWLDLDAMNKAVKLQRRLSSICNNIFVIRSKKEPKQLTNKEIQERFNEH